MINFLESDDFFFNTSEDDTLKNDKYFVLIIYDIVNNKRRNKIAKELKGFGFRVQKSCFEAMLTSQNYKKMLIKLECLLDYNEDSIRIYKIRGEGALTVLGVDDSVEDEDVIII